MLKTDPKKTFAVVSISGESAGGDDIVPKIAIGTALKLTLGTGFSFGLALVQPAGRVHLVKLRRNEPQECLKRSSYHQRVDSLEDRA